MSHNKEPQNKNLKSRNFAFMIFLFVLALIFYGLALVRIKGF